MTKIIRVLVVDDHFLVREGIKLTLETEQDMEFAGEAADGMEGVRQARALAPDVILMDLMMPKMDGIEATREIKAENPNAHILVLTSFGDDNSLFPAIKAGASGYLMKDIRPEELLQAIRTVHRGETFLQPSIALKVIQELRAPDQKVIGDDIEISEREMDVLKFVAQGYGNLEIAEKLVLSERTVHRHISSILGKLHLANRTQAALYALRKGLASLNDGSQ